MGACCCCLHIRDPEEDVSPCQTRNCICIHTLWGKFTGVKSNEQLDAPTSNSQGSAPLNSNAASNNIQSNIITFAPRVLHFEADTTCSSKDKNERSKGRMDYRVNHMGHDSNGNKSTGLQWGERSTAHCSEFESKFSYEKPEAEVACAYESSEDEDVCPTCLEEYIPENPRIVLQCSHSYHLGCIYEWMERSENCPICGKMMMFDEEA